MVKSRAGFEIKPESFLDKEIDAEIANSLWPKTSLEPFFYSASWNHPTWFLKIQITLQSNPKWVFDKEYVILQEDLCKQDPKQNKRPKKTEQYQFVLI